VHTSLQYFYQSTCGVECGVQGEIRSGFQDARLSTTGYAHDFAEGPSRFAVERGGVGGGRGVKKSVRCSLKGDGCPDEYCAFEDDGSNVATCREYKVKNSKLAHLQYVNDGPSCNYLYSTVPLNLTSKFKKKKNDICSADKQANSVPLAAKGDTVAGVASTVKERKRPLDENRR